MLTLAACAPSGTTNGTLVSRSSSGDVYAVKESSLVAGLTLPGSAYAIRQDAGLDRAAAALFKADSPYRCVAFEHLFWNDTLDYQTRVSDIEYRLEALGYKTERGGAQNNTQWGVLGKGSTSLAYVWDFSRSSNIVVLSLCRVERKPQPSGGTTALGF